MRSFQISCNLIRHTFLYMNKLIAICLLAHSLLLKAQQNSQVINGSIKGPFLLVSKIYPGTQRNYWVYVPKEYNAAKAACVMVVQDGLSRANGWRLPVVLDSLIAARAVPVIVGIFVDPGTVPSNDTGSFPRFNRSFEYDALGDRYSRFLLDELLPEVSRSYNLSSDPNDRSIAGASSGAICAFNVAWERPDAFRRVFSSIGTYVGLRGAHEFPTLIRKSEPKPLRVFLQDGTRDNNIYAGDWWVANQDMLSALTWAGYEINHAWGDGGGHDSRHTITILPDALKWLWKDYPSPIHSHTDSITRTNPLLRGHLWEEVALKGIKAEKLTVGPEGELWFSQQKTIYRLDKKNNLHVFATLTGNTGGISFQADGKLYVANLSQHKIIALDSAGAQLDIVNDVNADFLTASQKGIYFSDKIKKQLGFYSFADKQIKLVKLPGTPAGLALSAEQTFINVGFEDLPLGYSFRILANGSLDYGQEYIHYHIPYGETMPRVSGLVTDTANLLYSATALGIQMSDQLGRVNLIISGPAPSVTDIKMGGDNFNVLYAISNGRLFRRELHTKAALSWLPPVKPSRPRL